jgi:aerobic carbon-monoxide dehydrogenase medium subunit
MKAPPFRYARPNALADVFTLLDRYGEEAKILAGGQSLMATLNMRLSAPKVLIDINRIGNLAGISIAEETLTIGAMTRHTDVERSPLVATHAPLLAQAVSHVGHAAIRNRGTFGGSLAFADPAAEFPACVVALKARLVLESGRGRRVVKAEEFFQGLFQTALTPDELLVAVQIPIANQHARHGFAEVARRHGDYAIIGVAVAAEFRDGAFSDARLVYFGAGDKPVTSRKAAAALERRPNSAETCEAAARAVEDDLDPPHDLNASAEMRVHLAKVLTRRVLGRFPA